MATIYRAHDTRLGRDVALKLLRPEISADRDLADRFRREALAATVLRHREHRGLRGHRSDPAGPFLVMDLIEGEDLAARLVRTGPLPPAEVARIGLDIARALGVAHVRGIVHRDVKPSNILLARDGRAMITDFGIARLAADAEGALPGTTLGSVQYFSPEQAQGLTTTPASDVYGLGLVHVRGVDRPRPWSGETPGQIALARVGRAGAVAAGRPPGRAARARRRRDAGARGRPPGCAIPSGSAHGDRARAARRCHRSRRARRPSSTAAAGRPGHAVTRAQPGCRRASTRVTAIAEPGAGTVRHGRIASRLAIGSSCSWPRSSRRGAARPSGTWGTGVRVAVPGRIGHAGRAA